MSLIKRQIYYRNWYAKNRAKRLLQCLEYARKNKKRRRELYEKNKEEILKKYRAWKIRNGWIPKEKNYLYKKKVCRVCKRKNKYLMKSSGWGKRQYWICRVCNTNKRRKLCKTEKGKALTRKNIYKSIARHPLKQEAREKMHKALKIGLLVKSEKCNSCGKHKKTEGHHEDYTKPLKVVWLCRTCHNGVHKKNGVL
jgi:hypothetical protein